MPFIAYLLQCNDGSYYTGHTDNLDTRMAQHQSGALGGYTAKRLPVALRWSQEFATRDEAFAAERQIKGKRCSQSTAVQGMSSARRLAE
jgi:putative endonuclease